MKTILTPQKIAGGVLVVLGSVLVAQAASIDRVIATGLSPAAFPSVLAWAIVALGIAIMLLPPPPMPDVPKATSSWWSRLLGVAFYAALGSLAVFALDVLGFIVVSALIIILMGVRLGAKPLPLVLTAVMMPVVAQILFENAFGVPLAHGLLRGVLG